MTWTLASDWMDALLLTTWVTLMAVLWRKPSLSLRKLRWLELIAFGPLACVYGWWNWGAFSSGILERNAAHETMSASAISLPWFSMIAMYGLFIPNTWRRCVMVIGCIALAPYLIGAAAGLASAPIESHSRHLFLFYMTWWLGFAALLAVYGSHKIGQLRRAAFEARQFGQYRLKQPLGAGGMGEVYLAEHLLLRRPCAIKLIRSERAGDGKALLRFEREVQVTATLSHPNTIQIFDYGHTEDGTFYYVMELLPGLNLHQVVRQHGPLPPERAVHLLRQVCGSLREAHGAGLVHRDIKPGNIMLCRRGGLHDVAKLLDFGLVREVALPPGAHLTLEGAVTGTPAYMSPEQAAGRGELDARSDIYSLGAVAYFALTSRAPFAKPTTIETLAAHLYEMPPPPTSHRAEIPAELEAIVMRCLAKDPGERFPDAASLDAALAACPLGESWTEERAAAWWQTLPAGDHSTGLNTSPLSSLG